jgi:hypothetical protein
MDREILKTVLFRCRVCGNVEENVQYKEGDYKFYYECCHAQMIEDTPAELADE